ncbi:MAG: prephenate dehydrogenase [Planctomycetota bacterium]
MKDLRQITIIGLGLLGGSAALAIKRYFNNIKTVGYTHRASTRRKAKKLGVADVISGDIKQSVSEAQLVIIATPICIFEEVFKEISDALPAGCIVTDVGSTKVQPHRWAAKQLPKTIRYVGSHPIAGSEQRGVEYATGDLFDQALCIITKTAKTNAKSIAILGKFWSGIGCKVKILNPNEHDRIFANISHLPHMLAGALINASRQKDMELAGSGFIDASRIASGPGSYPNSRKSKKQ